MARKGKGNNTAGRKKVSTYRFLNGQEVRPVLYVGKHVGHGTYMAGMIGSDLVMTDGVPVRYNKIG